MQVHNAATWNEGSSPRERGFVSVCLSVMLVVGFIPA